MVMGLISALVSFILCYSALCYIAVPDGKHGERAYIKLKKTMARILFFPLSKKIWKATS